MTAADMEEVALERATDSLCAAIGYTFRDRAILIAALTHRSYANESQVAPEAQRILGRDNQRLEYLGDSVLSLVLSELLFERAPLAREGELSRLRAAVVNEAALAEAGVRVGVGHALRVGRGEERAGGRTRASIVADALEALFGAVHVDGGLDAARATVSRVMAPRVDAVVAGAVTDEKTRLQEHAQAAHRITPRYDIVASEGPDHERVFEVEVRVEDVVTARGRGRSKKDAEQAAARAALATLGLAAAPPHVINTEDPAMEPTDSLTEPTDRSTGVSWRKTLRVRQLPHAQGLPLPSYATEGAAGLDLVAAVDDALVLEPMARAAVPTGLEIAIPPGHEGQVRARSGRALKEGLAVANGPGTIDEDYRGEVKVIVVNLGAQAVQIRRGERIAQLVIAPVTRVAVRAVDVLDATDRGGGGFGSTGR